ncbi:putative 3-hydroxyphenylpropionic transporter MhpT [Thermoplasmatales archaeon]|nr:putative 3-hydroxyphenylpropionic transporter MhpT [Thermoplasmatales archaeon]
MANSSLRRLVPPFIQIMILQLLANFTNNSYAPLSIFIKGTFNINSVELGLITSSVFLGSLLAANIGGIMVDRLGSMTALKICFFLLSLGSLVAFTAQTYFVVVIGYIVIGFGYGIVTPATNSAIINEYYPKHAVPMGVKQAGVPIGAALSAIVLPLIAIRFSLRDAFLAMMALAFVIAMIIRKSGIMPRQERARSQFNRTFFNALRNHNLVMISIVAIFLSLGQQSIFTYFVVFLKFRGYEVFFAELMLAVMLAGAVAGRVAWPILSQYVFHLNQRALLLVIVVLSGIMLILVPIEASEWYLTSIGSFFLGFTAVAWNSTYVTIISEEAPRENVGVYSGAALSIMYIGVIVGTPLYGYIIDTVTYTTMWRTAGSLLLAVSLLLLLYELKSRRDARKKSSP